MIPELSDAAAERNQDSARVKPARDSRVDFRVRKQPHEQHSNNASDRLRAIPTGRSGDVGQY